MSSGSLIPQALLLTSLLMLPQCAKLDNEGKRRKRRNRMRWKREKRRRRKLSKKEVKFIVIYDHAPLDQGHSGRIFWHPRYPSMI